MDIQDLIKIFKALKDQRESIATAMAVMLHDPQLEPTAREDAKRELNMSVGFITALDVVLMELEKIAE